MTVPLVLDLVPPLVERLTAEPRLTCRQLVRALRDQGHVWIDKRAVNRTLYGNPDIFTCERSDASAPQWFVGIVNPLAGDRHSYAVPSSSPRFATVTLYEWQREAMQAWRQQDECGVVEAVTGTGKTHLGLAAAAAEIERAGKVLVLVPTRELQAQWAKKLEEQSRGAVIGQLGGGRGADFDDCDIIVSVVNSARSADLAVPEDALVVADECHRYGSDANQRALDVRFPRRLGLSATYERADDGRSAYLDPYFGGICYTLSYERALADEVIAHFAVALVGTQFSDQETSDYELFTEKLRKYRKALVAGYGVPSEPPGEFMRAVSKMAGGGYGSGTGKARAFLDVFAKRRKLLAQTPVKTTALDALVPALRECQRAIVFTQTIEGARDAARRLERKGIRTLAIHSELTPHERHDVLRAFSEGRIHAISAPQVLDEGIDVPEADLAIIMAASKSRRQMIQRMGRVLRKKPGDRLARFVLMYVEDTSEDPAHGAFETFLEEVTALADAVSLFPAGTHQHVPRFLNETRRGVRRDSQFAWNGSGTIAWLGNKSPASTERPSLSAILSEDTAPHLLTDPRALGGHRVEEAGPALALPRVEVPEASAPALALDPPRFPYWHEITDLRLLIEEVRERQEELIPGLAPRMREKLAPALQRFISELGTASETTRGQYLESRDVCAAALERIDELDPSLIESRRRSMEVNRRRERRLQLRQSEEQRWSAQASTTAVIAAREQEMLRELFSIAHERPGTSPVEPEPPPRLTRTDLMARLRQLSIARWRQVAEEWEHSGPPMLANILTLARARARATLGERYSIVPHLAASLERDVAASEPSLRVGRYVEAFLLGSLLGGQLESSRRELLVGPLEKAVEGSLGVS